MCESTRQTIEFPVTSRDALTELLRLGAQEMLATAIEAEVGEWIADREHLQDKNGHRQVVRNGRLPRRKITTGVGQVEIEQPRVRDNRPPEEREKFTSKLLPPYLRKTKSIDELLPWLYLKGISTSDFNEALQSLLGAECPGLSASTITRLIQQWQEEYKDWSKRSLTEKRYVYVWADGVYFNIRLEEDRQCILVLMGATEDGQKELLAVVDGYRESEQSWTELLLGREVAWRHDRSEVGRRRRRPWLLEGLAEGVSQDERAALLVPQERQRHRQAAQAIAGRSQRETARDLDGRHSGGGQQGIRPVRCNLPGQVPEGSRVFSRRIVRSCWRSTTSRPNTGFTCARPTRSRASSRP